MGLPDWMKTQPYDVDARIAADDRAEWQKPDKQPEMLRPMLQALLAERLMLQVYRESKESALYTLVVGKGGPKFEETKPDVAEPWFQISRMAR